MNTWTFRLEDQPNQYGRQGFHGLWFLLTYGEADEHYPEVVQTPTLRWQVTDEAITVEWEALADLERLMNCQLGDFRHGIAVPPGFETDPDKPGFYVTARAHHGICGRHFYAKSGRRRSRSRACKMVIDNLESPASTPEAPKKFQREVMQHDRATGPKDVLIMNGAGRWGRLFCANIIHPGLAKWNSTEVSVTPKDYFLLSFSCLSYLWVQSVEDDVVGISLDGLPMREAARFRRRWASLAGGSLYTVHGGYKLACWMIGAVLDLPLRSYAVLYVRGGERSKKSVTGLWRPEMAHHETASVYRLLDELAGIAGHDGAGHQLRVTRSIPVRVFPSKTITALDVLIQNLGQGQSWYVGIGPGATCDRNQFNPEREAFIGFTEEEQACLLLLHNTLGNDMEQEILRRMNRLFGALVHHYNQKFEGGRNNKVAWQRSRDRARRFALSTELNRATHRATILKAINAISAEANFWGAFTEEQVLWLLDRAEDQPVEVQQLLIMGCAIRVPKTDNDKTDNDKTDNDKTDND